MSIDIEEIRRRTNHAARGWPEDRVLTRLSVDVLDLCDALDTARAEIADLKLTAPLQAATILRVEKAEAQIAAVRALAQRLTREAGTLGGFEIAGRITTALDARP